MFSGSIVALVTPFLENGAFDEESFRSLVAWHVEEGSDAIVICGTTGEAPTLTDEEQLLTFKIAVEVADGKVPIIAGTGSYDTRGVVRKTKMAQDLGASGCLVVVPYYSRPTPEGCVAHFQEVAKVGLPVIVYHHPARTGLKLPAKTLAEIGQIPGIVGIKEGPGDVDLTMELTRLCNCPILSGDDLMTIPVMSLGGVGIISVVANLIPRAWKELTTLCAQGNFKDALEIFHRHYALCRSLLIEVNPQGVKYALSLMGKCQPHMRLPLLQPKPATQHLIRLALEEVAVRV
jgi:4-hydroxy-tetrahydrodipicolinate synthase